MVVMVVRMSSCTHGLDCLCLLPLQPDTCGQLTGLARIVLLATHLVGNGFCIHVLDGVLFRLFDLEAVSIGIGSPSQLGWQWWRSRVVISIHV